MRTTATLDPAVEALVKQVRERGVTPKEALNDAVRSGLAPSERTPFRQRARVATFDRDFARFRGVTCVALA